MLMFQTIENQTEYFLIGFSYNIWFNYTVKKEQHYFKGTKVVSLSTEKISGYSRTKGTYR